MNNQRKEDVLCINCDDGESPKFCTECGRGISPQPQQEVSLDEMLYGFATVVTDMDGSVDNIESKDFVEASMGIKKHISQLLLQSRADAIKEVVEIVEFERIHFWGNEDLEKQTKINNTVVDNIIEALSKLKK